MLKSSTELVLPRPARAVLESSPSSKDGVGGETEVLRRLYGCELVQEASILLKLSQVCAATGQVLLHLYTEGLMSTRTGSTW